MPAMRLLVSSLVALILYTYPAVAATSGIDDAVETTPKASPAYSETQSTTSTVKSLRGASGSGSADQATVQHGRAALSGPVHPLHNRTGNSGALLHNSPAHLNGAAYHSNDTHHHAAGHAYMLRTCDSLYARKVRDHDALSAYLQQEEKTRVLSRNDRVSYDFYEPEWTCETEFRLGMNPLNTGDGPKFVCAPDLLATHKSCLIYSIGSNYDSSFERGVRKYGPNCEIHTFDGTMNLNRRPLGQDFADTKINFHNYNFGVSDSTSGVETKSLSTIVESLGHKGRTINLFKIDCEGCEYSTIPYVMDAVSKGLVSIQQILIEVHKTDASEIQKLFMGMRAHGFMIFHKERNHWGCNGYLCVEFSLVHESFAKQAFVASHCPADSPLRRQLVAEGILAE